MLNSTKNCVCVCALKIIKDEMRRKKIEKVYFVKNYNKWLSIFSSLTRKMNQRERINKLCEEIIGRKNTT